MLEPPHRLSGHVVVGLCDPASLSFDALTQYTVALRWVFTLYTLKTLKNSCTHYGKHYKRMRLSGHVVVGLCDPASLSFDALTQYTVALRWVFTLHTLKTQRNPYVYTLF
jgi:hypothetical protein